MQQSRITRIVGASAVLALLWSSGCGDESGVAEPPGGGSSGYDAGGGSASGGSGGGGWPDGSAAQPSGGSSGSAQAGSAGSGGAATGGQGGGAGSGGSATGGQGGSGCAANQVQCTSTGPCEFPQGVPDPDFIAMACTYQDTDPAVDAAVNQVMVDLSGCGIASDCPIAGVVGGASVNETCQNWFAAVTAELRNRGFCAGQHIVGSTDEIAVSNTCCQDKWYGYHICNYGGGKVVWNPGARRGWWQIAPQYCP